MPFCTKCGDEYPEGNQFCGKCGAPRTTPAADNKKPTTFKDVAIGLLGLAFLGVIAFGILAFAGWLLSSNDHTRQTSTVTAQTDADREYLSKIGNLVAPLKKSMLDFHDLMASPQPEDDSWRTRLQGDLLIWQTANSDLQKISPPPRWIEMNKDLLESLSELDDASRQIARGLDDDDPEEMRRAGVEIGEANALGEKAVREMSSNLLSSNNAH